MRTWGSVTTAQALTVSALLAAGEQIAWASVTAVPGDGNADWSVDLADYADFSACIGGPGTDAGDACACFRLDDDGDVDLADYRRFQVLFTDTQVLSYPIRSDADDGTEVNDSDWLPNGLAEVNCVGATDAGPGTIGLRFHLPNMHRGSSVAYAQLVVPTGGEDQACVGAQMRIVGVAQDGVADFSVNRTSEPPRTASSTIWTIDTDWQQPAGDRCRMPFLRRSPDIAAIVNEVLARPGWGAGAEGKKARDHHRERRHSALRSRRYFRLHDLAHRLSRAGSPENRALSNTALDVDRQGTAWPADRPFRDPQRFRAGRPGGVCRAWDGSGCLHAANADSGISGAPSHRARA